MSADPGFLLEFFVRRAGDRLRSHLANIRWSERTGQSVDSVLAVLQPSLSGILKTRLQRVLILEVNVARLQGRLAGETGEERFASFLESLRSPHAADQFWAEYSVLHRACVAAVDAWSRSSQEMLERLATDWPKLEAFCGASLGSLAAVHGTGDTHAGGRRVLTLRFASETKLVYKPRSVAVDLHFQDFLRWFNQQSDNFDLRTMNILAGNDYGWFEFIEHRPCTEEAQVAAFYRRQGALLAILYSLGGVDLHFENLIAEADQPVIVDLEALFHPVTEDTANDSLLAWGQARLRDSVQRIGLLPRSAGGDLSGIGAAPEQITNLRVMGVEGAGTDAVRVTRIPYKTGRVASRPYLGDEPAKIDPDALVAGFEDAYRVLLHHKQQLLREDSPWSAFLDDKIRVIVRPTMRYSQVLRESWHPNFLRKDCDREKWLDQITDDIKAKPWLAKFARSERAQLAAQDIPYFWATPRSRAVTGGDGEIIADALAQTGEEAVRERLLRMSERDLAEQMWLVRASLIGVAANRYLLSGKDLAVTVGEELAQRAFVRDGAAIWPTLVPMSGDKNPQAFHTAVTGIGLYDGLSGIALFLAYLGKTVGDGRYTDLAKQAFRAVDLLLPEHVASAAIGSYSGLAGILYAWVHAAALFDDPSYIEKAHDLLPAIASKIDDDQTFDMIGGSAGAIAALVAMARTCDSQDAVGVAIRCAEHLLKCADKHDGMLVWELKIERGFAHGVTGLAFALAALGNLTRDARYLDAARAASAWEESLLVNGLWTSRHAEGGQQNAWCHGAAGIALGRLAMHAMCEEQGINIGSLSDTTHAAVEEALQASLTASHCLCHGSLGNLEALRLAANLEPERWRESYEEAATAIQQDIAANGYRSALPYQTVSPGLMTGLAGLGFGFLRLQYPNVVPNILLLEPPHRR